VKPARRRPPRPLRKGIYLLPSLLTTGNLFAGYYSLVASIEGEYRLAAMAIGIAFLLDGLDGRIARLTNTQSEFGKVYDSIADVIAFGAAPSVLALSWGMSHLGRVGWLASFFFLVCAALRLVRFSVATGPVDGRFFIGFPSPAAAGLVAALAFYWPDQVVSPIVGRGIVAAVLLTAGLMVSRFKYRSFKDIDLRRRQPHTVVVLLAMVIALIALDPENVLLGMTVAYAVSGPVERLVLRAGRRDTPEPAQAPLTDPGD
jgi:CDP-diacylglycerol--serine O-phosphatidyltransferase